MKRIFIIAFALLVLYPSIADAQRRGRPATKPVEEPAEDPRIAQMLASTQQIMFIDSMVVDADNFMNHIPLSPHSGILTQSGWLGTFTNEMGDHRLTTTADTLIASADFIANRWTEPQPINGVGNGKAMNPFLMPDGITLYFAQKSTTSIGGFDIFVTRYDSERGAFLRPENVGMPFTSEANDLFFAIDEFNQLGYFVTDRRQPHGKVCIYIFVPQESRRVYPSEAYSDSKLRSLANIQCIADTWSDRQGLADAQGRLQSARSATNIRVSVGNNQQATEMDRLRHEADVQEKALTLARNYYATANENERLQLRSEILQAEHQLEMLQREIREKEKQIPYEEM